MTTNAALDEPVSAWPRPNQSRSGPGWVRRLGYFSAILSVAAVSATFFIFLGLTPLEPTPEVITWSLIVNGVLLIALVGAIGWEITRLWRARKEGAAGARLHIRIVVLFSLVAVTPAILVAVVANLTFAQGVDHWFSSRTQQIVSTSASVANTYNQMQIASLGEVMAAMKQEVEAMATDFIMNRTGFQARLNAFPDSYGTPGVFIIDATGDPLMQAALPEFRAFPEPPANNIAEAEAIAPIPLIIPATAVAADDGTVRGFAAGIVKLDRPTGLYLYVVAEVDPRALSYMQLAAENAVAYQDLVDVRAGMQLVFGLIYIGVALVVLAAAIWLGLGVANRLVSPIGRLIDAADNVAQGDLRVEVPVDRADGDIASLSQSFNKMTQQLRAQRTDLVAASDQIDSRRRFIEAVLSGVTAGVMGIDGEGRITVVNRMALRILNLAIDRAVGAELGAIAPELAPLFAAAKTDSRAEHRHQLTLTRAGRTRTINVRVTNEGSREEARGFVMTLDDITDLVAAQRTAVWADVARRIAHEIKNPLTPIQLSAERLRRKFGRAIADDRDVFDQCVDTIIRQVGDIGRMVDEFATFARMPKPALATQDLRKTLRDAVFLMQVGYPDIDVKLALPDHPLMGRFDERLIAQVITNVIKNATEAIAALGPGAEKGRIDVSGCLSDGVIHIDVTDNGVGLPKGNRQLLLEPYMTTREKGTGLGLAIVRKIVEEHEGKIELLDAPTVAEGGHGARVRLTFPETSPKPAGTVPDRGTDAAGRVLPEGPPLQPVAE